jgi:methionine synthase II (cobalamin-independent)
MGTLHIDQQEFQVSQEVIDCMADAAAREEEWKSRAMTALELVELQMQELDACHGLIKSLQSGMDEKQLTASKIKKALKRVHEAQESSASMAFSLNPRKDDQDGKGN